MKRKRVDPLEECRSARRRLWKQIEGLTPAQRAKELMRRAKAAFDEAGLKPRWVKASPKLLRRVRKSG